MKLVKNPFLCSMWKRPGEDGGQQLVKCPPRSSEQLIRDTHLSHRWYKSPVPTAVHVQYCSPLSRRTRTPYRDSRHGPHSTWWWCRLSRWRPGWRSSACTGSRNTASPRDPCTTTPDAPKWRSPRRFAHRWVRWAELLNDRKGFY